MAKLREGKTFKKRSCCQVCGEDLLALEAKHYCIKKKVCPEHLQAEAVSLPGVDELHRWCHQCAKFEPLTQFEGVRRTCRDRLVKRRKVPASSKSNADAPGSPSGMHSQQPHFNDTLDCCAATSPTCSTNCDAGTAFCGFGTSNAMNTGTELQQYMQHELGCAAAAAAGQPQAAAVQMAHMMGLQQPLQQPLQQQQLGFMGMPAAASGARTLSVSDEAFDSYLDAMMQHELQQCLQQEGQKQLQQQDMSGMACPAPLVQCPGPAASQLAPARFAPALQQPVPAYRGPAATAAVFAGVDGSEYSCNSSAQLAADAYAKHSLGVGQVSPFKPAAVSIDRVDACMQRGRRLQELLQKKQALQRSASAAAGSIGTLPCMEMPTFLQGSGRTAMPAQVPAMPAHLSYSSQQPTGAWAGLSRITSAPVMSSTPALLSEPAQAQSCAIGMHGMPLLQQQGGLGLQVQQPPQQVPQQQQHEAVCERMARLQNLQNTLADVSAQIQDLKQIFAVDQTATGPGTAASVGGLAGVGSSFC